MSRWMIEKDGSGIEKSGTGIEKSGTGIEKSGTGIESIGKGVRWGFLSCALTAITFIGSIQADRIEPTGSLQLVVQNNTVAASWIIGDSIFSGVATLKGSFAKLGLTEVALGTRAVERNVAGSGSGIDVAGSGSGIDVAGSGSGIDVAGSGSGLDAITITLPQETGMYMEVSIGCGYATVAVNDSNSTEIVAFDNVNVISDTEFCEKDFDDSFINSPGADFQ